MAITFDEFVKLNEAVDRHQGSIHDRMERHRRACRIAQQFGDDGRSAVAGKLFERASDEGNLFIASEHVRHRSGQTPGPEDELTLHDWNDSDWYRELRRLRDAIRAGDYRHGPVRVVRIPKATGGHRSIRVANKIDRVVARGVKQVVEPLLDPMLSAYCVGSRAGFDRIRALALAETFFDRGLTHCVIDDLESAFDRVPAKRLMQIVGKRLPDERIVGLIREISRLPGVPGIPQGSACSPLLLNVYADATIDRPWRRRQPETPLIRYVDDLLLPCGSEEEAAATRGALSELAESAGWRLKGQKSTAVVDLDRQSARWLGFEVEMRNGRLVARVPQLGLDSLADKIAGIGPDDREALRELVLAWINDRGPAWEHDHKLPHRVRGVCKRVAGIAPFETVELRERLKRGWERWMSWRAFYTGRSPTRAGGSTTQPLQTAGAT